MNLKGTKTEKNLIQSYHGEVTGDAIYKIFAEQAREEGYEEIGKSFEKLAKEEIGHSEIFKRFLGEIETNIDMEQLKKMCSDTLTNLKLASAGEYKAYLEVYPEYARIAREEGFLDVAKVYDTLGPVELRHSNLLKELGEKLEK